MDQAYTVDRLPNHVYAINGNKVVGVTTITNLLPKNLESWAAKEAVKYIMERTTDCNVDREQFLSICEEAKTAFRKTATKAASTGTGWHEAVEQYVKTKQRPEKLESAALEKAFDEMIKWEKETNVKWGTPEMVVGSLAYQYGGTLDLTGIIYGKMAIVDHKTSKRIYESQYVQLAAYTHALCEMRKHTVKGADVLRVILHVDKEKGYFDPHEVKSSYDVDLNTFLTLRSLYSLLNNYKYILTRKS